MRIRTDVMQLVCDKYEEVVGSGYMIHYEYIDDIYKVHCIAKDHIHKYTGYSEEDTREIVDTLNRMLPHWNKMMEELEK